MGALFHIVRSQLYADKIIDILREYGTNATDTHIETDQTQPLHVFLPTELNPTLRIRDFDTGLSLEVLKDYASIGESTKR